MNNLITQFAIINNTGYIAWSGFKPSLGECQTLLDNIKTVNPTDKIDSTLGTGLHIKPITTYPNGQPTKLYWGGIK